MTRYRLFLAKRWLEDIFIFPFILAGRIYARVKPAGASYRVYFFFPFYHVGGAEKVHAQVAAATGGPDCIIYFTRKSHNALFRKEFERSGCVIKDISRYTDNKWIYFVNLIWRGILSGHINRQEKPPVVFNGQCNFGYKISRWISPRVPQLELIHSLCSFSYIRIPFMKYYYRTVMIARQRIQDHIDLYRRYGIPSSFDEKIVFILNGITIPATTKKNNTGATSFKVLYSGRATPEKRVHLVAEIAREVKEKHIPDAEFIFLGDVKEAIPGDLLPYCRILGYQSDPAFIHNTYLEADMLILVSDTEGFAMVIMEAMAVGLPVVSTAVGEIPAHVKNGVNGFLLEKVMDAKQVVNDATNYIVLLAKDDVMRRQMGETNIAYAAKHFSIERFNGEYRQLFEQAQQAFEQR